MELKKVLDGVRVMVEQQAADKGIDLRVEGPREPVGTLLGDILHLTQVLLNLVGNAVKFTPRGSVTLSVRVEAEAVLAGLEIPALEAASVGGAEPGCGDRCQRILELTALLEAGKTRALDHLPWLERCLGAEASGEGVELVRQIEALDFPAPWKPCTGWEGAPSPALGEHADQPFPSLQTSFR